MRVSRRFRIVTNMRTTKFITTGLLATSLLIGACGNDSNESAATQAAAAETVAAESTTATGPAAATATSDPGAAAPTDAPAASVAPTPAADGIVTKCPDVAELGPIYGSEVTFDEANATSGALGLLFCPYIEVVAPGTTNNFGIEPVPDEFSLTFTNQNIAVDDGSGGEVVPGVGEAALWSESSGLSVWTGKQGLIVSIIFDPPAGDAKTVAIAIAQHVLG
jgi:hypothetical protein